MSHAEFSDADFAFDCNFENPPTPVWGWTTAGSALKVRGFGALGGALRELTRHKPVSRPVLTQATWSKTDGSHHNGAGFTMNKARLRALFASATDATLVVDALGVIVMANLTAEKLLGCDAAPLVGTPVLRWMPAWDLAKLHADVRELFDGSITSDKRGLPLQVTCLRSDGQRFPVEIEHSVVVLDGQKMCALVARRTTAHSHERVERLDSAALLIASMSRKTDAVVITDATGRCVYVNEAFVTFHGFDSREECRRKMMARHPLFFEANAASGELVAADHGPVSRALSGEVGVSLDYMVRHQATAEASAARCNFAPIRGLDGAVAGTVVVARGTTPGLDETPFFEWTDPRTSSQQDELTPTARQ